MLHLKKVFFSSKLVDYKGSKTVIGITPGGTARKLFKNGGIVMSHNDPEKLSLELMDIIKNLKAEI